MDCKNTIYKLNNEWVASNSIFVKINYNLQLKDQQFDDKKDAFNDYIVDIQFIYNLVNSLNLFAKVYALYL